VKGQRYPEEDVEKKSMKGKKKVAKKTGRDMGKESPAIN